MPPLLCFLVLLVLDLSLLISTLCTCLVELSLPILLALLKLAEPLSLPLLLFPQASSLTSSCFFTHQLLTLVLGNFIIKGLLCLASSLLLLLLGSIRKRDLLSHDPYTLSLSRCSYCFFFSHFFDVSGELGLLLLESFLLLKAELFTRGNLIDQDLSTASTSISGTLLTLKLRLDSLQSFNLHHRIQSLLLRNPVLLKLLILVKLTLANRPDLRGKSHLVHVLHIVIVFVHLRLGSGQERVFAEGNRRFDLEWRICLAFTILPLHTLLARNRHCHSLLSV